MKAMWLFVIFGMISLFSDKAFGQADINNAKEIYLAEKCQRCHSITALNIASTGQKEISDLSVVGSEHNAEWLIKFLNREVAVNGKKHLKNLKTSGADIEKLAKWLGTLKSK